MKMEPKPGLYEHYKGQHYRVLCVAQHSETEQKLVVYQALYGEYGHWVRPLDMFVEMLTVDGQQRPRFAQIPDSSDAGD